MAEGRHFASQKPTPRATRPSRPRVPKRRVLIAVLACVLAGAGIVGVVAWLTASGQVENSFEIGTVIPEINEDGPTDGTPFEEGDSVKQNVDVTNKGNVPIYVRAQVNIYWQDANGNQLWDEPGIVEEIPIGIIPDGTLYMGDDVYESIPTFELDSGAWVKGADGYYYWTLPLDPETTTSVLIDEFKLYHAPDDGRTLVCDVSVQAIQADPADAVLDAWRNAVESVDPTTGALTLKAGE